MAEDDSIIINSVAEYLERLSVISKEMGGKLAFRGISNHTFSISSTAARRLFVSDPNKKNMEIFKEYHTSLISKAKEKGYHRKGSAQLHNIEILAELQHFGAATGLIDFTKSSLVALFFAASNMEGRVYTDKPEEYEKGLPHGIVYIIDRNDSNKFKELDGKKIGKKFFQLLNELHESDKLWIWTPSDLNNRIPSQHSVFIFGKPEIDKIYTRYIKINPDKKIEILNDLDKFHNINEESLFNDLAGFSKANNYKILYFDKNSEFHLSKALNELLNNNPQEAIKSIIQAYEFSNKPDLLKILAFAYKENREPKEAEKVYTKLIQLFPNDLNNYLGRAYAREEDGEYEKASEDINYILKFKIEPLYSEAKFQLRKLEVLIREKNEKTGNN